MRYFLAWTLVNKTQTPFVRDIQCWGEIVVAVLKSAYSCCARTLLIILIILSFINLKLDSGCNLGKTWEEKGGIINW